MSKKFRNLIMMCLMLTLLLVPAQVSAIDSMDLTKSVNFTVSTDNKAMAGMELELYKVAETNEWAEFTLTGEFADYNVEVNGLDNEGWKALAETLSAYVDRDEISPLDSELVNKNGVLNFGELEAGLYLVYGSEYTYGETIYTPTPLLICLPSREENSEIWDYDVLAQLKYEFRAVEKAKTALSVHKVWNDGDRKESRPDYISVQLLQNGIIYDEVKLTADNNWRYTWDELDADSQYKIAETEIDGYKISISREKDCFVITNSTDTKTPTEDENLPQTGVLWWPVPVLVAAGLLCIIIGLTRRRGSESGN